jgi:hypothetical protein
MAALDRTATPLLVVVLVLGALAVALSSPAGVSARLASPTAHAAKSCGGKYRVGGDHGYKVVSVTVTKGRVKCRDARRLIRKALVGPGPFPYSMSCRCIRIGAWRCMVHTGTAYCWTRGSRRKVSAVYR